MISITDRSLKSVFGCLAAAMLSALALTARGQPAPATQRSAAPGSDFVSRAEYDQLKRDQDALRKELQELKEQKAQAAAAPQPAAAPANADQAQAQHDEEMEQVDKTLRDIKHQLDDIKPGGEKLLIAGDAFVGYTSQRHTTSTFSAGIAPLVLFQPTDRLLIEAAADIGIATNPDASSSTSFDLTIANASYIINDNVIVGGGLFVSPFAVYHKHFDPPWINKLPDDPLVFSDGGLSPGSVLGAFVTGAVPIGSTKLLYDVYVSNGPNLEVTDPATAGSLHFDNYTDLNENKAVGGRIGFAPIPQVEVGYSVEAAKANPAGFHGVDALLQAVDAAYKQDCPSLYGVIDVHGAWIWSHASDATYDPTGALGFGPLRFNNDRQGGYVTVAYRPSRVENKVVKNLEFIGRFDAMTSPLSAPGGDHERRWTFGVDYWITPSVVLKAAYELDHRKASPAQDAFLLQLGLGL